MYRFMVTRRWLIRILAGLLLVAVCVRLGLWQLDRNEHRSERNEVIHSSADAEPVPVETLSSPGAEFDADHEWRHVEVRGTYDANHEFLLRLRPLDGQRGVHVITPLVLSSGEAILVDRGFFTSNENIPEVPPPQEGDVELLARLRSTEDSREAGDPAGGLLRAVNVAEIAEVLPYPVHQAWAEAIEPVEDDLIAIPGPTADAGPHLSYAIQWFIFAVIGITGFVLLIRTEARARREPDAAGAAPEAPADPGADPSQQQTAGRTPAL
ncbi:SURF1 family cytochrome oxidase biogenesis protein [Phytoactinopolyspora mesophila]|uniref:SURF1 family cytochrome oxidase biogenesis protein n=1 Tax=Phytoactinopolyspora mesophila TaxID=2650750 RepID=UPI001391940E